MHEIITAAFGEIFYHFPNMESPKSNNETLLEIPETPQNSDTGETSPGAGLSTSEASSQPEVQHILPRLVGTAHSMKPTIMKVARDVPTKLYTI